jgi:hypothetical protein
MISMRLYDDRNAVNVSPLYHQLTNFIWLLAIDDEYKFSFKNIFIRPPQNGWGIPSFHQYQFPFIILVTVAHIQLKCDIWIYDRTMLVMFEFGYGPMIFGRVMPLDEIFSFRPLYPQK